MKTATDKKLLRIIDANYNRAKEGLRVAEDIFRFYRQNKNLTRKTKALRHALSAPFKNKRIFKEMIRHRDSNKDIGRTTDRFELKRKNVEGVLYANLQRSKESVRVLEEIFKIIDKKSVSKLKSLRYNLYSLEKGVGKK